ncbi:MAG: diguanylate cyclase [Pseudomonadota bacterium]
MPDHTQAKDSLPDVPQHTTAIPRWLVASFGFPILLVVLVVGASVLYLAELRGQLENVVRGELHRISQAHGLRMIIRERILNLNRIFLEDDPFEQDAAYLRFLELGNRFIAVRRQLEPQADDAAERRVFMAFRAETIAATPSVERVVDLYQHGRLEDGRRHLLAVTIPAQARVFAASDAVHAFYRERGTETLASARRLYDAAFRTVVGLGVSALVLALMAAALAVRRIMRDRIALQAEIEVRRNAEARLHVLRDSLESLVEARTTRLQETAARLEEAQRIGQMGHWEWDIPEGTLTWSEQVYRLFGLPCDPPIASYEDFLCAVHPDDRDKVETAVAHGLARGEYQVQHRIVRPDGSVRQMQEMAHVTYDPHGNPLRMVGTVQDITESHRLQSQLWELAHFDALTGLPNRKLLLDRLQQAILLAQRQHATLAVALIDLDHFKEVNDTLGHAAGDSLLQVVAERLRQGVRQSDIVARFAGDEFVVVLPDAGTPEQIACILAKLRASLQAPFLGGGLEWPITASIGVASYPQDGTEPYALLQAADEAMYAVKRTSRDAYRFYRPPTGEATVGAGNT